MTSLPCLYMYMLRQVIWQAQWEGREGEREGGYIIGEDKSNARLHMLVN